MSRTSEPNKTAQQELNFLQLKRMHIDTHQEPVIYMHKNCHVCRSEGFYAQSRVRITTEKNSIIATVNMVTNGDLSRQEVGLSESAWKLLSADEGERAYFSHAKPADSMSAVSGKVYGNSFNDYSSKHIIHDITRGYYSDIQLAAFVTACAGNRLNTDEIISLTKAMVDAGSQLEWGSEKVMDKHCVGGLPGNRTTPIVVAIVSAAGLIMPKTSSRGITSPAGTADTMETLAPVTLSIEQMRSVVEQEGGCIAWGGSVSLSPADDILIRVERALDLDSEGQLVASVISKKVAAGSTHALIDLPVGITAKVRDMDYATKLSTQLERSSEALGLKISCLMTDGQQPVGFGIGPALEAQDILTVLQNSPLAPQDLRQRALLIAAKILEMGDAAEPNHCLDRATEILDSGKAWTKFQAICEAQGGMREPPKAPYRHEVFSDKQGIVCYINNRFISKLAKLAGAPSAAAAGILFKTHLGDIVDIGTPLFELHAETKGELEYAIDFLSAHPDAIRIEEETL
ncbi:thymidine phosphorylase [Oleiphilus sp. HI0043]|uniref:thymidine phosphorylase family protein n=3 Tax=unclassified Oleiphilus TaxID=2631174 RepID=UPI0007C37E29|nr:thymidine phosphorylase family protein [Oleiphilus sp. HI0043]KZY39416.1 thymidine phosphorylase [Oleiphilus sp. HI0043]